MQVHGEVRSNFFSHFLSGGFVPLIDQTLDLTKLHWLQFPVLKLLTRKPALIDRRRSGGDDNARLGKIIDQIVDPGLDDAASGLRNLIDAIDQDQRAGYELAVDPLLRHSVHNVG